MRWIRLTALSISAGIAGCITAEVGLRLFYPQPLYTFERHLFQADPDLGYRLTPHAVMTHTQPEYSYAIRANSFGFRGREPNPDAQHRVLVLGDSFGMGFGVKEGRNLCEVAQAELSARGHDVDIFNTSITAYFGGNQISVLDRLAEAYAPELVVLLFYWNDIGVTESKRIGRGHLRSSGDGSKILWCREILNRRSHLFCLVKRFHYATLRHPWGERAARLSLTRRPDVSATRPDLGSTLCYIAEMEAACHTVGSEFRVVLLPYRGVLNDPPGQFPVVKQAMIDAMITQNIVYIDWAPLLPVDGARELSFRFDQHWNEDGHRFFGRHLVDVITRSLRLSAPEADAPSTEVASDLRSPTPH